MRELGIYKHAEAHTDSVMCMLKLLAEHSSRRQESSRSVQQV